MAIQSDITALQLFNEKADKLESLSFTKSFQSGAFGLMFRDTNKGREVSPQPPDSEALEAFVLTLRFFMQERDGIAINDTAKRYETLPVNQQFKGQIFAVRDGINGYLDHSSSFKVLGRELTRRNIFEIFMYGYLTHTNPDKYEEYKRWQSMPFVFPFLEVAFAMILIKLLQGIFRIREINKNTLKELSSQPIRR